MKHVVLYGRSVLNEVELMRRMIEYVMQKLKVTEKSSDKVIQLLEILSTLCTCKGVPVPKNQSTYVHSTLNLQTCDVFLLNSAVIILQRLQEMFAGEDSAEAMVIPSL